MVQELEKTWNQMIRNVRLGRLQQYIQKNLYADSKPFRELLKDDVPFKGTKDQEKLNQNFNDGINEETILARSSPKCPFRIHVNVSSNRTRYILVKELLSGKHTIPFISRVLAKDE